MGKNKSQNWIPEQGQKYYYPIIHYGTAYAGISTWDSNCRRMGERYRAGLVFRTREEAVKLGKRMLAVAAENKRCRY